MNNIDDGETVFIPFKKFEWILNNKTESFTKKSKSLVEVWQNLAQCKFENSDLQYIVQIIDWAKLHTLNIVLTGEWKKFKDQYQEALLKEVKLTQNQLTKINNAFFTRCQKLIDVINNPWSDPTLEYLVSTPNAEIGPKEIEFFCVETAYLTSVRLKKLCESQCEDLALNLVKAFMKCYRMSQTDSFNLNATETQVWFIFDIYVALLYKFKENDSLLEMLKGLSAEEGLNLIKRFAKKRVKISKVWKHCHRIAILASRVYISSTILKPIEEIQSILKELVRAYLSLHASEIFLKDVIESIRGIIRLAETAAHIYVFCDVFQEQFETQMKSFIIELYIRALTTDMNLLERQKSDNEKDKMAETTKRLAGGFTKLTEVLKGDVSVSRECIMTAFSLEPTTERLKKIEELAKLSGFEVLDTGQEWKCKLHPPILPSDDLVWVCNSCGEYMCEPHLSMPLNTNIALNEALTEEKLGITRELCDDLVVLLSCPRYQVFSWLLDWPNLHRLCIMYLNDPEATKNVVTELKFLDIDYSIFAGIKKEPLDEYAGIERGYEHYLDHEFNSDDDQLSNISEDTGSSTNEMHYLPVAPRKSDPDTLKSLRMFRPTIKRPRNNTEITDVPEKVLKPDLVDFAIPSSSKQTEPYSTPVDYSSLPNSGGSFRTLQTFDNTSIRLVNPSKMQACFTPRIFLSSPQMTSSCSSSKPIDYSNHSSSSTVETSSSTQEDKSSSGSFTTSTTKITPSSPTKTTPSSPTRSLVDFPQMINSYVESSTPIDFPSQPQNSRVGVSVSKQRDISSIQLQASKGSSTTLEEIKPSSTLRNFTNSSSHLRKSGIQINSSIQNDSSFTPLQASTSNVGSVTVLTETKLYPSPKNSLSLSQVSMNNNAKSGTSMVHSSQPQNSSKGMSSSIDKDFLFSKLRESNSTMDLSVSTAGKKPPTNFASSSMVTANVHPSQSSSTISKTSLKNQTDLSSALKSLSNSLQVTNSMGFSETKTCTSQSPNTSTENNYSKQIDALCAHLKEPNSAIHLLTSSSEIEPTSTSESLPSFSPVANSCSVTFSSMVGHPFQPSNSALGISSLRAFQPLNSSSNITDSSSSSPEIKLPKKLTNSCSVTKSSAVRPSKTLVDPSKVSINSVRISSSKQRGPYVSSSDASKGSLSSSAEIPPSSTPPNSSPVTHNRNVSKQTDLSFETLLSSNHSNAEHSTVPTETKPSPSPKINHSTHPTSSPEIQTSQVSNISTMGLSDSSKEKDSPVNTKLSQMPLNCSLGTSQTAQESELTVNAAVITSRMKNDISLFKDKNERKAVLDKKQSSLSVSLSETDNIDNISFNATQLTKTYPNQFSHKNRFDSSYYKTYPGKTSIGTKEISPATKTSFDNTTLSFIDSNPKNGQVATLQQVGGQVAIQKSPTNTPMDSNSIGSPNNTSSFINPAQKLPQNLLNKPKVETVCTKKEVALVKLPNLPMTMAKMAAKAQDIVLADKSDTDPIMANENVKCQDFVDELQRVEEQLRNSATSLVVKPDSSSLIHYCEKTKENRNKLSVVMKKMMDLEQFTNEVPHLFEDLPGEQLEEGIKSSHSEDLEVKKTTHEDTMQLRSSTKKPVWFVNKRMKYLFGREDDDKSVISIEDSNAGYADTLINPDSEYDSSTNTNPLLQNVLNKIDCFKKEVAHSTLNSKESVIPKEYLLEHQPGPSKNKSLSPKETKYCEKETKNNKRRRSYSRREPKYESYPDTGSDSQVDLDSDDQYNRCYIELFRDNLLYDSTKGVFKNIDSYLKKSIINNNNINDSPSKWGKKSKKGCPSKRNRKSKTGNTSNKTVLDVDSNSKPKSDIPIRDIRVILNRLPAALCRTFTQLGSDFNEYESPKIDSNIASSETKNEQSSNDKNSEDEKSIPTTHSRVLESPSLNDRNYVRSVLANVPGLHDTQLMRPADTDLVINVVQIAGGRNNTSVPVANAQTSTQVTPHIQRIGQPRVDKPQNDQIDNTEPMVTSAATSVSSSIRPATSQPSTLINILSQQVIRPGQSNCMRTRPSPLINIVSHQIIRPSTQAVPKMITSSAQTNEQVNDTPKTETSSEQPTLTTTSTVKNIAATVKNATVATSTPAPGTILQFICKSATLPKFQQAFGKTVYQTAVEAADATTTGENSNTSSDTNKKIPVKNPTVNIQPIQGSVIYTRQVPVGQTINLIPPGRQVFRIATSNPDQISLVKDTVIHSKMSALLTAALQGKKTTDVQVEGDGNNDSVERVTVTRPALVQNTRIVKPVIQIPSNVIRTSSNTQSNLSSTTLEQLREFDMVYKQIKERSNTGTTPPESSTQSESETSPQGISVTYLNQGQKFTQLSPVVVVSSYCNLQPAASPALSVTSQGSSSPCITPAPTPTLPKVSSKTSSKGKSLKNAPSTHASKASPIPKPQQKPQEDEHTTQRIFDILAEYAEQLRNSPDLNNKPAPRRRSNPPTNPNHNSKRKKSSGSKKPSTTGSAISESDLDDQRTIGSEDSSCGVVQLSVKDEEQVQSQTTESNDSTSSRPLILTETSTNAAARNLIIADSSVGEALKLQNTAAVLVPGNYIMPVSMMKGGQQIAVVSGGSKILATVPARSGPNMLLFQSFLNQNRKPGVSTVKYSTLQPISGISSQNLAAVSGQSPVILPQNTHNLTAVTLGQPLTLKKMEDSDNRVNTELLLAIAQPRNSITSSENSPRPDSSTNVQSSNSIKLDDSNVHTSSSSEKVYTYQKSATPIATPVISQTSHVKHGSEEKSAITHPSIITLNIGSENNKEEASKVTKRVQSVLVTACTSNGPMLSHTPPRYRKPSDTTTINNEVELKGGYLHNGEKKDEAKHFQATAVYFPNKYKKIATNPTRLDRELHQLCLQRKQAALERELRLQKSLSEECEDLGVDEPSTSDLFPEADLLFDSNHSPSFDQTSQDTGRKTLHHDIKDKSITLFSDDDNSSSLRTDFLFDSVQYQTEGELQYEQSRQLTNGQSSTSNESGSSCEDNTLLQNCASMSDVTLNSPISPEFTDNQTHMNKYKYKYSNRKKTERHKPIETWTTGGEVSSSEDTMCSSELGKITHSPKRCVIKRGSHSSSCDEDEEFKVVRVAISKTDLAKDEESCEESHYDDDLDSPSGRGARRSVKKMCPCCNGAEEGNRKRPSSRPHTPALHKKAFLNKKR